MPTTRLQVIPGEHELRPHTVELAPAREAPLKILCLPTFLWCQKPSALPRLEETPFVANQGALLCLIDREQRVLQQLRRGGCKVMDATRPPLPQPFVKDCKVSEESLGKGLIRNSGLQQYEIEQAGHKRG